MYDILKRQLFDVDLTMKWTRQRGEVGRALVRRPIRRLRAHREYALRPRRHGCGHAHDRCSLHHAGPVADTDEYRTVRKRAVYQAALESALLDGTVSDKERDVLATLADQLGLSAGDARAIERDLHAVAGVA